MRETARHDIARDEVGLQSVCNASSRLSRDVAGSNSQIKTSHSGADGGEKFGGGSETKQREERKQESTAAVDS